MANDSLNPIPSGQAYATGTHNQPISSPRAQMWNDNDGVRGAPVRSSIEQTRLDNAFYIKKILDETKHKRKFSKMASTIGMPKHMGSKIRAEVEIPLLDDRNLNDQGIDARGVQIRNGNLYGSSRDIGKIIGALPRLTEEGGRVNRVGFSRAWVEGTFDKFGFFTEYSDEMEMKDQDPQLVANMYRQMIKTAEQVREDYLQTEILQKAGTVIYSGNSYGDETMDETSIVTLQTLNRLQEALDENDTPRETKYIFGSGNYATKTASVYRTIFVGRRVLPILENLSDNWGNRAFKYVDEYGAAIGGKLMEDEVGIIGNFRVVLVDDMLAWEGAGAEADDEFGMATYNGRYNVYPLLCIGTDAFSSISFDGTGGKGGMFKIHHQRPNQSHGFHDPFGEIGFISIKWWDGVLIKRPERIGLIKTVAPM